MEKCLMTPPPPLFKKQVWKWVWVLWSLVRAHDLSMYSVVQQTAMSICYMSGAVLGAEIKVPVLRGFPSRGGNRQETVRIKTARRGRRPGAPPDWMTSPLWRCQQARTRRIGTLRGETLAYTLCLSLEPHLPARDSSIKSDLQSSCFCCKRKVAINLEPFYQAVGLSEKWKGRTQSVAGSMTDF